MITKDNSPKDEPEVASPRLASGTFNLSDKIKQMYVNDYGERGFCKGIDVKDVKEFLKRLKGKLIKFTGLKESATTDIIDKLAGDNLK